MQGRHVMRRQLTVLIPCKNERKNIGACIDSARLVADEVLVADSLSTDDTLDVVRARGGCRIIEREFVNYSDFKNWAIPQAQHEWVLIVDADERVTPELAGEIHQMLQSPPEHLDGFWIGRRNHFMGHEIKHCGWNTDAVFRLLRRDVCRYAPCRVHEGVLVKPRRAGRLKNRLLHYTYWSYDQYFDKYVNYTRWGAMDYWDHGGRTGFLRLMFQPFLRFLQLYILRLGFLDGLPGLQICMLQSFFVSFVKQARLWEMEHALPQPDSSGAPPDDPADAEAPAAANAATSADKAAMAEA
jgi:glycosyltransferase involved in cell wall biosynthesis